MSKPSSALTAAVTTSVALPSPPPCAGRLPAPEPEPERPRPRPPRRRRLRGAPALASSPSPSPSPFPPPPLGADGRLSPTLGRGGGVDGTGRVSPTRGVRSPASSIAVSARSSVVRPRSAAAFSLRPRFPSSRAPPCARVAPSARLPELDPPPLPRLLPPLPPSPFSPPPLAVAGRRLRPPRDPRRRRLRGWP